MQQAIPARFRDSTHSTSSMGGNVDRRSTVAFSPSDHLDNIFQAVRQQVDRWGENAKWKIELILLSEPPSSSNKASLPPAMHPEPQVFDLTRPIKPHQNVTRGKSETWSMPYAADLQHNLRNALERQRYLEGVVRAQDDRIRQLQTNTTFSTIQSVHTMAMSELKEQHRIEIKLLQTENQALAKKFMRISSTLQRIEKIGMAPEDTPLDRRELTEERKVLLRKLHLSELRLRARDAELGYLHNLAWSYRQSDTEKNDTDQRSPYLLQKQYSPTTQPTRPLSALDSLSILADQMLSDPDFGSEGKESSASPDTRFIETKTPSLKRNSTESLYHVTKEEGVGDPLHISTKRKRHNSNDGLHHHGNLNCGSPCYRGMSSHQLSSERPSSAFHTFVPIQHPQMKHSSGPISLISRKDGTSSAANTPPTLMSPVPSSYHDQISPSSRK